MLTRQSNLKFCNVLYSWFWILECSQGPGLPSRAVFRTVPVWQDAFRSVWCDWHDSGYNSTKSSFGHWLLGRTGGSRKVRENTKGQVTVSESGRPVIKSFEWTFSITALCLFKSHKITTEENNLLQLQLQLQLPSSFRQKVFWRLQCANSHSGGWIFHIQFSWIACCFVLMLLFQWRVRVPHT